MASLRTGRFVSRLTRDTLALILAGGRGSRLQQLTDWRAKPAVPFGGNYRIIDFPLSNCINSGIRRVAVLTQYKSHSLMRHIQHGWSFLRAEFGEFVDVLPAQQRIETSWYEGTANAVLQNLDIIHSQNPEYVLILAGDHIYKMDYGSMLAAHVENDADVTVGCIEVAREEATAFGVMATGADQRIHEFAEKPADPKPMPGNPDRALASMGIYIFNKATLFAELQRDRNDPESTHDFGRDIIPSILDRLRVFAYPFRDPQSGQQAYWRDVGTLDSFWEANMELIGVTPELNLYDDEWPIWTYQEQAPPAKFVFDDTGRRGMAVDSMVSSGCIVSGATITRSLLFLNAHVHSYAQVTDSVVFPEVDIGRHCRIRRAVIDKRCVVPAGTVIGYDAADDAARFHVSPRGIVLVTPEMLGQAAHHV